MAECVEILSIINALKYYRSSGINRNQSEEMVIIEKKYTEEEKENVSQ